MIISALSDRKPGNRQEKKKSGRQKSFGQMLTEQTERLFEGDLEGKMVGYARNGQVYFGQAMQRTYN